MPHHAPAFSFAASLLFVGCGPNGGGLRVLDVSPTDGDRGIDRVPEVEIVFSRALDPETVKEGGIRLVPDRPFSVHIEGDRVVLTPDAPLPGGHPVRVVVEETVTDLRGRALRGGTFSSTFITSSVPPGPLDVDPAATPHKLHLGFDSEGNGVALWVMTPGFRLTGPSTSWYALYTADDDAWSEPEPLGTFHVDHDVSVVSNGRSVMFHANSLFVELALEDDGWIRREGYLDLWGDSAIVPFGEGYAALKQASSGFQVAVFEEGTWRETGDPHPVSTSGAAAIASDGDALALAWVADDEVWLEVLYDDAWTTPLRVDDPLVQHSIDDVSLVGATDGTGWLVGFVEHDVWVRRYTRDGDTGVLEAPVALDLGPLSGPAPELAASEGSFAAAWSERVSSAHRVRAAVYPDPDADSPRWSAPSLLGFSSSTLRFQLHLLSTEGRYGAFWRSGSLGAWLEAALSDPAGGWSSKLVLGAALEGYQVAAGGGGFAVAMAYPDRATWARSVDGWEPQVLGAPGTRAFGPALAFDGNALIAGFTENGTLMKSDGRLLAGPWPGEAGDPAIVATGDGRSLATWRQGVGGAHRRFARVHDGADWQVPVPLGPAEPLTVLPGGFATMVGLDHGALVVWQDSAGVHARALEASSLGPVVDLARGLVGSAFALAGHGDAAIIAWVETVDGTSQQLVRAIRYQDGAFSDPETAFTSVASDHATLRVRVAATDGGFGIAVVEPDGARALTFIRWDGAWRPEQHLGEGEIEAVALSAYGGEYAIGWYEEPSRMLRLSRTFDGELSPAEGFSTAPLMWGESGLQLAGGPDGFVVAVSDEGSQTVSVATCTEGAWSTLTHIDGGRNYDGHVAAKDGFLTTWYGAEEPERPEGLYARRWRAGAWGGLESLGAEDEHIRSARLFATESGFVSTRVSAQTASGRDWRLLASRPRDAGWEDAIEVAQGATTPRSVAVDVSPEGRVVAAWTMPDPDDVPRVWAAPGAY